MVSVKIIGTQAEQLTRDLLVNYRDKVQSDLRGMDQKTELSNWEDKYYRECLQFCNAVITILSWIEKKD